MPERIFFEHPLFGYLFTEEHFLSDNDPLKAHMKNVTAMFDYLIDFLRDSKGFPHPQINELCELTFWLINQRVVMVAQGLPIPTNFGFTCIGSELGVQPIVCIREDWLEYVAKNRTMGLGAIILAASQARDFWNGRTLTDAANCQRRAHMYEAEMLLTLMQHESFTPNEYQTKILDAYPKGLSSAKNLLYKNRKPFMGVS